MAEVSVIVPVYNKERYLTECLESLISQTFSDIEILCIDDGSTDNSITILEEFSKKDARIHIIKSTHAGAGAARNIGIKNANSPYIYFVDSDDWIEKICVERLYNKIRNTNSDLCICGLKQYNQKTGEYIVPQSYMYRDICEDKIYTFRDLKNYIFTNFEMPTKMCKRDLFVKNGIEFPENVIYEDVVTSIKTIIFSSTISFVKEALYIYRKNSNNSIVENKEYLSRRKDFWSFVYGVEDILYDKSLYGELENEYLFFVLKQFRFNRKLMSHKDKFLFDIDYKKYLNKIKSDKYEKYLKLKSIYNEKFSIMRKPLNFISKLN